MTDQRTIIDCYNKTANTYASRFMDELSHKHFDRLLLNAFATENKNCGKLIDLGCGPGQTVKYLSECGIHNITGVDLSPAMIETAKALNPQLHFETADMLNLNYPDKSFGCAIAFYSIVHFSYDEVATALKEIRRVLDEQGELLFSFHIGDHVVHLDNFLDEQVTIDFYFFDPLVIIKLLTECGFEVIDAIERKPYKNVEYPSNRAYIWVKKTA